MAIDAFVQNSNIFHWKRHRQGYKEIEDQDSKAADEPGQVFEDESPPGALERRQHHDDTQPVGPIAHHGQGEQQVGRPFCWVPPELQKKGSNFQQSRLLS